MCDKERNEQHVNEGSLVSPAAEVHMYISIVFLFCIFSGELAGLRYESVGVNQCAVWSLAHWCKELAFVWLPGDANSHLHLATGICGPTRV